MRERTPPIRKADLILWTFMLWVVSVVCVKNPMRSRLQQTAKCGSHFDGTDPGSSNSAAALAQSVTLSLRDRH